MLQVCAWCDKEYGDKPEKKFSRAMITHGICDACRTAFYAQLGLPVKDYLNTLSVPVVLLDNDLECLTANDAACELLGGTLPEMEGEVPGKLFDCEYSRLPDGCGHTIHCSGCTVRRLVMDTHATGITHSREPATVRTYALNESHEQELYISTEKVDNMVLLQIDDISTLDTI